MWLSRSSCLFPRSAKCHAPVRLLQRKALPHTASAKKIQAMWRGHATRKTLKQPEVYDALGLAKDWGQCSEGVGWVLATRDNRARALVDASCGSYRGCWCAGHHWFGVCVASVCIRGTNELGWRKLGGGRLA